MTPLVLHHLQYHLTPLLIVPPQAMFDFVRVRDVQDRWAYYIKMRLDSNVPESPIDAHNIEDHETVILVECIKLSYYISGQFMREVIDLRHSCESTSHVLVQAHDTSVNRYA